MIISNIRSDSSVMLRDVDGAYRPAMHVSLLFESSDTVVGQYAIEGQLKESDGEDWRSSILIGPASNELVFNDVEVGTEYNFRVRILYTDDTLGDWVSSWVEYDDDGATVSTHTTHLVVGNDRDPPDVTAITVTATANGALAVDITADWLPNDLAGYELRYYVGTTSDWSAMTSLGIISLPYETTRFAAGSYTFAAKVMSRAVDPHEDATATPATPHTTIESESAFFQAVTVVGPVRADVTTVTASTYTCQDSDEVVLADTTSNDITVTLPTAAEGRAIRIKKIASGNTLTIDTPGSETIDGAATRTINTRYEATTMFSDGTDWWIT